MFEEELMPFILKLLQKIEEEGTLSFYEASITLITKGKQGHWEDKKITGQCLLNIDAKINKKLVN